MTRSKMRISIFCYFFITFVLDGLLRLSGLFVLELLQSTELSRQDAVVPFILSWVVSNIFASFSAILKENRYSEYIILFGVLLCAAGTAFCILATNITTLIICWGLLFGSGYGIASPHLSIRLKCENEDKLSSILQMTSSLGATIMPFVFSILTSYYALQGSFLIFCGIILNYLPLALAAARDIEISIPNIKWRVRKKSSQYFVTKHEEGKSVSVESFINSLEPDLILEISQREKFPDEEKNEYSVMNTPPIAAIPPIGRKRSETRGNDLQGLDSRFFPQNRTPSRLVAEIKKYEKDRNTFEESYIADDRMEQTELNKNCNMISEKKICCGVTSDLNLTNKILDKITEQEIEETAYENNELERDCCKACNNDESNGVTSTCELSESENEPNVDESNGLTSPHGLLENEMEQNVYESNDLTSICGLPEREMEQNVYESNDLTSICGLPEGEMEQNVYESNGVSSTCELSKSEIEQNIDECDGLTSTYGLLESEIKHNECDGLTSTYGLLESEIKHNESNNLTSTCGFSETEIEQNLDESNVLTSTCGFSEKEIEQNVDESNVLTSNCRLSKSELKQNVHESSGLNSNCGQSESEIKQNVNKNKVGSSFNSTFPMCDQYDSKNLISSQTEQDKHPNYQTDGIANKANEIPLKAEHAKSLNCSSSLISEPMQSVQKENVLISPKRLETKNALNTPLVIKIHVEEYTFTADEKHLAEKFNSKKVKSTKDNHIKQSKSVKLDMHDHKFLDNPKFSQKFSKCSKLCKSKLSDIYSISENCDMCNNKIYSEKVKHKEKICDNQINVQWFVKYLEITTSRVWLCILLMSVIFEINLVTLLMMFADLGSDIDDTSSDFKWILIAFGVGGFIGKICCCKISKVIPEKYNVIGVVLFLLNGLSTAGILYSSNLNWLAGFYCILGALEGGITYLIPKFISEYIDGDVHSSLLSVKSFFSGVLMMCIPYGIGLFRDEMGDYEFLLQILSCSSILCAFLAYFLPHLISTSQKEKSAFLRSKLGNV